MLSSDLLILFPLLVVLCTGFAYLQKAVLGYLLWYYHGFADESTGELSDVIEGDVPVRFEERERAVATRLSTWPPRWLISTTAVGRLPPVARECLITHARMHVASCGRLLHDSLAGIGFAIVVSSPLFQYPLSGIELLGTLAFGLLYFAVIITVIERQLVYRADVKAARVCGIEAYGDFLGALEQTNASSSRLVRLMQPTPQLRRRYLE